MPGFQHLHAYQANPKKIKYMCEYLLLVQQDWMQRLHVSDFGAQCEPGFRLGLRGAFIWFVECFRVSKAVWKYFFCGRL